MDMIIFGGQSNMQGQSDALTSTAVVENCYEYRFLTDEVVPLKNPVGEDIAADFNKGYAFTKGANSGEWLEKHITGSSCYGNTNLVPEFCRVYNEITKREVLAVHIAKGSTVIAQWLPGTKGYEILIKKSFAAKKDKKIEHIFFVWLQGESDAIMSNTKDYYKEKITELCNALKEDIGIEKFGIIRVGRFVNDQRDDEIISAQDEICKENDDFLMLTEIAVELNKQPEYMNPFVGGHYSAKGLEKLGAAAAETLANEYK